MCIRDSSTTSPVTSLVRGEVVEFLEKSSMDDLADFKLPDYENEEKVIIDVITLDSESCAPCQYMMEAVRGAAAGLEDKVTYVEHKVKFKESVAFMLKLGVSNIPTICIDGEVKYVSIIPEVETLRVDIMEAISKKQG